MAQHVSPDQPWHLCCPGCHWLHLMLRPPAARRPPAQLETGWSRQPGQQAVPALAQILVQVRLQMLALRKLRVPRMWPAHQHRRLQRTQQQKSPGWLAYRGPAHPGHHPPGPEWWKAPGHCAGLRGCAEKWRRVAHAPGAVAALPGLPVLPGPRHRRPSYGPWRQPGAQRAPQEPAQRGSHPQSPALLQAGIPAVLSCPSAACSIRTMRAGPSLSITSVAITP